MCLGLTPGMPGTQASSLPWTTAKRLPSRVATVHPVGDPRRQADDRAHGRVLCDADRHGSSHREAEQHDRLRPLVDSGRNRSPAVLDAEVEPVPGLDPVAHLEEAELRERGSQLAHEVLERRAPVALDLTRAAAVEADDRVRGDLAGDPRVGARGEGDDGRHSVDGYHLPLLPGTRCQLTRLGFHLVANEE